MQRHAAHRQERGPQSDRADRLARARLVTSASAAAVVPEVRSQPEWAGWSHWRCEAHERWLAEAQGVGPAGSFSIHLRLDPVDDEHDAWLAVEEVVLGIGAGDPVRSVGGRVDFTDGGGPRLGAPRLVLPVGAPDLRQAAAAVLGFRIAPRPSDGVGSCRISGRRTLAWCHELQREPIDVECTSFWDADRPERVAWLARSEAGLVRGVLRRVTVGRS